MLFSRIISTVSSCMTSKDWGFRKCPVNMVGLRVQLILQNFFVIQVVLHEPLLVESWHGHGCHLMISTPWAAEFIHWSWCFDVINQAEFKWKEWKNRPQRHQNGERKYFLDLGECECNRCVAGSTHQWRTICCTTKGKRRKTGQLILGSFRGPFSSDLHAVTFETLNPSVDQSREWRIERDDDGQDELMTVDENASASMSILAWQSDTEALKYGPEMALLASPRAQSRPL